MSLPPLLSIALSLYMLLLLSITVFWFLLTVGQGKRVRMNRRLPPPRVPSHASPPPYNPRGLKTEKASPSPSDQSKRQPDTSAGLWSQESGFLQGDTLQGDIGAKSTEDIEAAKIARKRSHLRQRTLAAVGVETSVGLPKIETPKVGARIDNIDIPPLWEENEEVVKIVEATEVAAGNTSRLATTPVNKAILPTIVPNAAPVSLTPTQAKANSQANTVLTPTTDWAETFSPPHNIDPRNTEAQGTGRCTAKRHEPDDADHGNAENSTASSHGQW